MTGATELKAEPTADFSLTPVMMAVEGERQIMTQSQYKCLELLSQDGPHNKTGRENEDANYLPSNVCPNDRRWCF